MKDIISKVAAQNDVSEAEVREEIEKAIHEAFLQKSSAFVEAFGDRESTPEEFIKMMADQIHDTNEDAIIVDIARVAIYNLGVIERLLAWAKALWATAGGMNIPLFI